MEEIKGYVEHIVYQNSENGYTVFQVIVEEEELTCVGMVKGLTVGETIEAKGEMVEHALYGEQFKIASFQVVPPEDVESMRRYLASGAIKGVGESLAKRIVKKFGKDTFRIMEEEPERLVEIKGISERIAREISGQMEEKRELRSALIYLQQYGISNTLAVKIYDTYRNGIYTVMQQNPYRLSEDVSGVGFKLADEIASKIGIKTDSDFRISSGVLYTILQATTEGHLYLPMPLLLERSARLLGVEEANIEVMLSNMAMDRKIVIKQQGEEKQVYGTLQYYTELNCAKMLQDLSISLKDSSLESQEKMQRAIVDLAKRNQMELDSLQVEAILRSYNNGVFILTGGPGTGKTTTINMMLKFFELQGLDMLLAAPTGRAAKRMTEATGYEARTIHRMLEINGAVAENKKSVNFERNAENPLQADVIIIDEMSMVDVYLLQSLLQAITIGTRIVFVGDVDQLPSVGAGNVLRDMIESQCFPLVILDRIYRQAETSDIVVNAHKINQGQEIRLDNKSKDFFFLERNDPQVIYKHIVQLIKDKLPGYVEAESHEIQILTPMRKGNLGVEQLNKVLQMYLNPPSPQKKEKQMADGIYREGDKVMQIKNNYQIEWEIVSKYNITIDKGLGVFNGDMGKILEINERSEEMTVVFDEGRKVVYPFSLLEELDLAYAITIHKSQGSEYPAVILPLLSGPQMLLNKNLLYTAVTRAKKCVTILGSKETIQYMIQNEREQKRYTSLKLRLQEQGRME